MNLNLLKKPVAKAAEKAIEKTLGCKAKVHVDKMNLNVGKGEPKGRVSLDVELNQGELTKLLEKMAGTLVSKME